MSRLRIAALAAIVAALSPLAHAQFLSELVGFNDNPDVESSREMFLIPETSGSTAAYLVPNTAGLIDHNNAWRASGFQTEGAAAMNIFFDWADASDASAWARITATNGPVRPNPSLHLQGKVRFRIVNESELFFGNIGLCIGVRETGQDAPQMSDGGAVGDIEWVGVSGVAGDPNSPTPIPILTLAPSASSVLVEFDLATGQVRRNGVLLGAGVAGFTGDGVLSAPNNRGTLEHIAIVNMPADPAVRISVHIDELQFEAPVADPALPPTVVSPIIADDPTVTVTDLHFDAQSVQLLRNGLPLLTDNTPDFPDHVFTLPAPAVAGDVYTATQTVAGVTSAQSDPVTVLAEPPAYGFSVMIDEDGDGGCTLDPPGASFVGATDFDLIDGFFLYPHGMPVFNNPAMWQTIDVPLDDPSLIQNWASNDGALGPSPSGMFTMDSIWMNVLSGGPLGPHELYIDAIEALDGGGNVIQLIHEFEDGQEFMAQIRGQSETLFTASGATPATSYDGTMSHRVRWSYVDDVQKAIGLLTRVQFACGTSIEFPDTTATLRFHVLARAVDDPNAVALPVVVGPIIGDQSAVRVLNDPNATAVQLYIDGVAAGAPVNPGGASQLDFNVSLQLGESVSAKQTIGGVESGFALPRVASDRPPPPSIAAPVFPGVTSVTVENLLTTPHATAEFAFLYKNGTAPENFVGSAATGGQASVIVPVTFGGPLQQGDVITATQFLHNIESPHSAAFTVGVPGPILFAAPAQGDNEVRVIDVHPAATLVEVVVNGTTTFSVNPGGSAAVDVPVAGLVAGDEIIARMVVDGSLSAPSDPEIVTIASSTPIICDGFEYDQATYEATWLDDATTRPTLSTDQNTTDGGSQSLLGDLADHRVTQPLPVTITPTAIEPLVWNVNLYDPVGPGGDGDGWVQILENTTAEFFLMHIGMSTFFLTEPDTNYYQARVIGNGGPNWFNLNELDAPQRSVGWHNFTMVHKGDFLDIYVDGQLAVKNMPLIDPTVLTAGDAAARIGTGFNAPAIGAYYDDFCIELGAVRFQDVGGGATCPGDCDGNNVVDITDLGTLLSGFNQSPGPCDTDGSGATDVSDLGALLGNFNQPCP